MTSLYVDRRGTEIRVDGGALVFYENDKRIGTVPLAPLSRVILRGDIKLSAGVLGKLGEHNIGIIVVSGRKGEASLLMGRPHNDARRRLAQYRYAQDPDFCLVYARNLVRAKLISQLELVQQLREDRLMQRYQLSLKTRQIQDLIDQRLPKASSIDSLRGLEGTGASMYFSALAQVTPASLKFTGRNRRPPKDPFNSILSLGYTMLHSEAVLALYGSGLDPFIGFYHALYYGRESLASDVIEPLRAEVDAFAISIFSRQQLRAEDFTYNQGACMLGKAGRQRFYQLYEALGERIRHGLGEQIRALASQMADLPLDTENDRDGSDAEDGSEADGLSDLL